jgi:hypothetical protein
MKRANGAQVAAEGIDEAGELLFEEEERGSGIIQDVGQLGRGQADIEWKQDAAGLEDSEVGFKEAMAVEAEEGDAISWLRSGGAQSSSQARDAIAKFGIGKAEVLADNRRLARKLLLRVAKKADGG